MKSIGIALNLKKRVNKKHDIYHIKIFYIYLSLIKTEYYSNLQFLIECMNYR